MPDDEPRDMDERVAIPLDPEEALKGLLAVDPDDDGDDDAEDGEEGDQGA